MIQLFTYIVDFINTVAQLLVMLMSSVVSLIQMIPTFTTYTFGLLAWMPQPFAMFALLALSLSVLLFIVGRQT